MKISTILDHVETGHMALPQFQRGYVWNRDQVRKFINSLYRRHPIGSLLIWVTKTESAKKRGDTQLPPGVIQLILDGQQRVTTVYGIVEGKPTPFFDGNVRVFSGLHFNVENEEFEFYAPVKMRNNPLWIDITALMKSGLAPYLGNNVFSQKNGKYLERLNQLYTIKDIEIHHEDVTGEDKTLDVIVEIFNCVNTGGTKLSKADLALAKICAEWPDARDEMKKRINKWSRAGFYFRLEWLLRVVNAVITGEALFDFLENVDSATFEAGIKKSEGYIDRLLNSISSRLGLDHDRVLGSRYSFPLMARYLEQRGGKWADARERDRLLYWYIHTYLWGRYSGTTESVLNEDLAAIETADTDSPNDALKSLVDGLYRQRGELNISEMDFRGSTRGSRFYPFLYMMTRICHARDFGTGDELSAFLLGDSSSLEVHHIFPKGLLYQNGYNRQEANAIANFTFLTHETNMAVRDRDPAEYIPEYDSKFPGTVASHWIPMDPELWKVENYTNFLSERRKLLAEAANKFLEKLEMGSVEETSEVSIIDRAASEVIGSFSGEDEEEAVRELNDWVAERGLPRGEEMFELIDDSGSILCQFDLAWPNGIQEGLSQPVALLLDESAELEDIANRAGYRFFTTVEELRVYIKQEILQGDNNGYLF